MANTQGVNRLVASTLSLIRGTVGLASFDILGIIGDTTPNASFGSDRAKEYDISDSSTVAADWGTGSAEYKAFVSAASQTPKIDTVYIMKRDAAVAQVQTVTWSGNFGAGETISGLVNSDAISVAWNTDQATTMGDLNTAIAAAYGVATSTGTINTNTVTADAGYPLSINLTAAGGSAPTATVAATVDGRSLADDISDAILEPSTFQWFELDYVGSNEGAMLSGAVFMSTQPLLFSCQTNGATVKTSATDDIASRLQDANYDNTFITYRGTLTDYVNSALGSRVLAADPGSITYWHRNLTGVTADNLTTSEIGFIEGKNCNNYANIAGSGRFEPGVTCSGLSIQTIRDLYSAQSRLDAVSLNVLTSRDKTPFDKAGQILIESALNGECSELVEDTILSSDYTLTVPDPADVPSADKTNHLWSGITLNGDYVDGVRKISYAMKIGV